MQVNFPDKELEVIANDEVQTVQVEVDVSGNHEDAINVTVEATPGEWTLFT